MEEQNTVHQETYTVRRRGRRENSNIAGMKNSVVIFSIAWLLLVFAGFYCAKYYFDKTVGELQQTNGINVQAMNDRLDALTSDMQEIKAYLGHTGQSLSNSGSLQIELNNKIELLDKQLQELKNSLDVLKEAPNAKR